MCWLTLSPESKFDLGLPAVQLRKLFRLFFSFKSWKYNYRHTFFHCTLFHCTTDNVGFVLFFTLMEGLQQPASLLVPFSNGICSLCVSVSHFGSSHNISNLFIGSTFVVVTCDQWFFMYYCNLVSSVAQSCPTLCNPINCSTPGLPVHHQLPEFTQTHVHRVGDAIQPSHLLSSPSPPALNPSQHQNLF